MKRPKKDYTVNDALINLHERLRKVELREKRISGFCTHVQGSEEYAPEDEFELMIYGKKKK